MTTAALWTGFGGTSAQFDKYRRRNRNDRQTVQRIHDEDEYIAFKKEGELSQVLSCIVAGIYKNCKQEGVQYLEKIEDHWGYWGYEVVGFDILAGAYKEVDDDRRSVGDRGQSEDQCVRVVLFKRPDCQAPQQVWMRVEGTPDRFIRVELPKYLFAIRGTIRSRFEDLKSDIKVAFEVLHEKDALPVTRLLLAITRMYSPRDIYPSNIGVAGHSLGAEFALIATRSLAIDHGVVINPHLFNPPYLTVGRLASKAMRGVLNGVGDTGNRLLDTLGMKNILNVRAGTDRVNSVSANILGTLSRKGSQIAKSSNAENMKRDSQKLVQIGYVPHLYVNPEDTICNEYIKYFQRRHHVYTTFSSEVMQSVVPARSLHMIPSAVLYINNWAEGFPQAHKLHQWFRYRHVNLTVERKGLTADHISTAPSESIGILQAQDSRRSRA